MSHARFQHARGAALPQIVDIVQHLLAQCTEQAALARFRAQVAVADAHGVGAVLDADEPQHARLVFVAHNEPAVPQPVAQGVAAAVAPYGGAGEKLPHLRKKYGFVVEGAHLDEFTIFKLNHTPTSGTK